ncbi:MAG: malto-oligosyltrehalose trehalohydrolase [Candidatus Cyclobacteriaceae bacterium M3_2C_046]
MKRRIGANYLGNNICEFTVWAPFLKNVELQIVHSEHSLYQSLRKDGAGYWYTQLDNIPSGSRYFYRLEQDQNLPDPASLYQPEGVHGPSEVVDLQAYQWQENNWTGIPLSQLIFYELHVGSFSTSRDFDGVIAKIPYLKDLGINAIEIMPVAQFPGNRNWGYDGVYPFAVQDSYGGALNLQRLVDACHSQQIAVFLDVVYNHMGPEGNYLSQFGPYFTDKYTTPWGQALNFDDAYSDEVRNFFIQNALMWLRDFRLDGLRLDAVHAIKDLGATHFLKELQQEVQQLSQQTGVQKYLIAECDLNDVKFLNPLEIGGFGMDAQWIDEFHHAIHALVTGEKKGYYEDFGNLEHLKDAFNQAYVYNGRFSLHRKKTFGNDASQRPVNQFVVFSQNHDQVGNRMLGERFSQLISYEALKLVAGTVLLSPYLPFLFMGEEYGEDSPFLYFVSHTDPDLVEAVRQGRKREFESFHLEGEMSDPQSENTLQASSLKWNYQEDPKKNALWNYYKSLIRFRKENNVFQMTSRDSVEACITDQKLVQVIRKASTQQLVIFLNYHQHEVDQELKESFGGWEKVWDSAEEIWQGPGSLAPSVINEKPLKMPPESVLVYQRTEKIYE